VSETHEGNADLGADMSLTMVAERRFAVAAAVALREDYDAAALPRLTRSANDAGSSYMMKRIARRTSK
jgi:hypothetical protein